MLITKKRTTGHYGITKEWILLETGLGEKIGNNGKGWGKKILGRVNSKSILSVYI